MKKNDKSLMQLALAFLLMLSACNQGDKKEKTTEVSQTDTVTSETTQPAPQASGPDAVKAAPDFYKVLSDSMGIRILEVTYKPGDSSAMHSHPDYALYAVQGGQSTFYGKDGAKMESEMKSGTIMIRPGEVHSVKNIGKANTKVILFEVNRPSQTTTPDAAMDAAKVAPSMYKVRADSLGIRVLEINYRPGQSSAMHSHPDNALYVIQPGKAEFTAKDGKKTVMELKKGMTAIGPPETHSVKNIGNTTMKAILVEVYRAGR